MGLKIAINGVPHILVFTKYISDEDHARINRAMTETVERVASFYPDGAGRIVNEALMLRLNYGLSPLCAVMASVTAQVVHVGPDFAYYN